MMKLDCAASLACGVDFVGEKRPKPDSIRDNYSKTF
jgi:hypothetical protein